MLFLFALIGLVTCEFPCSSIPPGEYRGTLSSEYSISVGVESSMETFMWIERVGKYREEMVQVGFEFDADCRINTMDELDKIAFESIVSRIEQITARSTVAQIEYRDSELSIGGVVSLKIVPLLPGFYMMGYHHTVDGHVWTSGDGGIEVLDDSRMVVNVPVDFTTIRIKASYKFTGFGKILITTEETDSNQISLTRHARRTFRWIRLGEFEAKVRGKELFVEGDEFEWIHAI